MPFQEIHRKKCHRYNSPGHAHELTFSCFKGQQFLSSDRVRKYLADAILKARVKHDFDVWAYVFMPEHVHLLIWPRSEIYSISEILLSVKQSVSRKALLYLRENDPQELKAMATRQKHTRYRFWQDGGGYDRNITSRKTLLSSIDYIHNNPLRRELASKPEDWQWSSFREFCGSGKGIIPLNLESFPAT